MLILNRRGSHVGVVLSFVLFITFVMFMYVLLEYRVNQQAGKANTLEFVKAELLEKTSGEIEMISVRLEDDEGCARLNGFVSDTGIDNRIIVQDGNGNVLEAEVSGQSLEVDRDSVDFLHVYSSGEFSSVSGSLTGCQDAGYTIGLSKTQSFVFESKVIGLMANYSSDYETLKTDLNIGSRDEFGLMFTYANGTTIRTDLTNATVNIYATQIPIEYIGINGGRQAGSLALLVW